MAAASAVASSGLPLTVTDANSTLLLASGVWLVAVVALGPAWQCPYSLDLVRRWDSEVVRVLQSNSSLHFHNNSKYNIALINAWDNTATSAMLEVQAYPSVKLIQHGLVWTYRDSLNFTSKSIVDFAAENYNLTFIIMHVMRL
ncbi:hypothetical protein HDU84_001344 [Entophlyctis sp. JEL0112]|nr:hypothetical protein HDU84_001344 [Entophlyctis sp. JEL0112]